MHQQYADKLSGERLQRCYDMAPPRVRQYLEAEVTFVLERIRPDDVVLEIGCGYGRVVRSLAGKARWVVGMDSSISSLRYGRSFLSGVKNCFLLPMDARELAFLDETFDVVVCIQNGIAVFDVDPGRLFRDSVRVTRHGGTVLFSSYSHRFWEHRLEWFRLQSEAGLLGEIDDEKTSEGVVVCKDGFTSSAVTGEQFLALAAGLHVTTSISEVDESSLFCEMVRMQE